MPFASSQNFQLSTKLGSTSIRPRKRGYVALIFQCFLCSKGTRRADPGFTLLGLSGQKTFRLTQMMFMPAGTFRGCFKRHARLHKLCSDSEKFLQVCRNFVRPFQKACGPARTLLRRRNVFSRLAGGRGRPRTELHMFAR